jgi:hypothetical protein
MKTGISPTFPIEPVFPDFRLEGVSKESRDPTVMEKDLAREFLVFPIEGSGEI